MLINLPMMSGIAVVAEPLIRVLFGREWPGAVPLLKILALGGILWPLHVLNLIDLTAMGHSKLFLKGLVAQEGARDHAGGSGGAVGDRGHGVGRCNFVSGLICCCCDFRFARCQRRVLSQAFATSAA